MDWALTCPRQSSILRTASAVTQHQCGLMASSRQGGTLLSEWSQHVICSLSRSIQGLSVLANLQSVPRASLGDRALENVVKRQDHKCKSGLCRSKGLCASRNCCCFQQPATGVCDGRSGLTMQLLQHSQHHLSLAPSSVNLVHSSAMGHPMYSPLVYWATGHTSFETWPAVCWPRKHSYIILA